MADHTSTRRGILGAIATVSFASVVPAQALISARPSPDGGRWWRTYARMERIDTAHDRFTRDVWSPLNEKFRAMSGGQPFRSTPEAIALSKRLGLDTADDHGQRMLDLISDLQDRLISLPAPDATALHWKLNYLTGEGEANDSTPSWSRDHVAPIIADLRRAISGEA